MTDLRSRQDSFGKIMKELPVDQATEIINFIKDFAVDAVREAIPPRFETLFKEMGYSGEIAALTRLLAAKSGDTLEGAMLKALTLYGISLDAVHGGNRLAILNPDDLIVREIVGFETPDLAEEVLAK